MKKQLVAAALAGVITLSFTGSAHAISPLGELLTEWHGKIITDRTVKNTTPGQVTTESFRAALWRITNFAQEVIDMITEEAGLTASDVKMAYAYLSQHESYINYYAQFARDADSVAEIMKARAKLAEARGALMAYWTEVLGLKQADLVKAAQEMGLKEEYAPFVEPKR